MVRASAATITRSRRELLVRVLLWALAFIVAGFAGRLTIIDGKALSLVWPAAGVAAVWLATGDRRTWPGDVLALGVTTFLINSLTGSSAGMSGVFVVANILQASLFAAYLHRLVPDMWGGGGTRPLSRISDIGQVMAAAGAACLVASVVGSLAVSQLIDDFTVESWAVWMGRNCAGILSLGVILLLAGGSLERGDAWATVRRARKWRRIQVLEVVALALTSAFLYVMSFLVFDTLPLAFLLLLVTVWAGLRFSPLVVAVHSLVMGVAAVLFTLDGQGLFAAVDSLELRALLAQLYVLMVVVFGLALSLGRAERLKLLADLAASQRAEAERAHLLNAVLEAMHDGITVVQADGTVLLRNPAGLQLLGMEDPPSTVVPGPDYGLFRPDGTTPAYQELPPFRALAGEDVTDEELVIRNVANPGGRALRVTARLLPEGEDGGRRVMVVYQDVTADNAHRDSLSSFAGIVAHDLFNPLTVIDGWAESLAAELQERGSVTAAEGGPVIDKIRKGAAGMRELISDLLAYSTARDQSLNPAMVSLEQLVNECAELQVNPRQVRSRADVLVDPLPDVFADGAQLRQLFSNLIGNAVKYVAPGVTPLVRVHAQDEAPGWVRICVVDNGIGIPPAERTKIFEAFHRAETENYRGTGLGLAICRRIVQRHGGTIRVEGNPDGTGSAFVLTLPTSAAAFADRMHRDSFARST